MTDQTRELRIALANHNLKRETDRLRSTVTYVRDLADRALAQMDRNKAEGREITTSLNTLGIFQTAAVDADRIVSTLHLYEEIVRITEEDAS